jgi:MFS family permease
MYVCIFPERTDESAKVLTALRGSEAAANEELKEYASTHTGVKINKLKLFTNKIFLKSLALVIIMTLSIQMIGFNAVQFYMQTILESTQTSVKPEIASVIIGFIQLIASLCITLITDRFGRKTIMATSLVGLMVGMVRNKMLISLLYFKRRKTSVPLLSAFCFHRLNVHYEMFYYIVYYFLPCSCIILVFIVSCGVRDRAKE